MSIAECGAAWFGPERPGRFDILGLEHLNAAVATGRGVILYTGHFTTLEIMRPAVQADLAALRSDGESSQQPVARRDPNARPPAGWLTT